MVINPAPVALPVNTANLPTEAVQKEARLAERVPEAKAPTENVKLKPSAEDAQQVRPNDNRNNDVSAERQVQEKGSDGNNEGNSGNREGREESSERRQREEVEQREQQELTKLKQTDREVRAHEAAHASVGGQYAGAPSYTFQRGPDGRRYAVGGEVPIDTSRVSGDPAATIEKMQQVRRAALAPADPSSTDLRVAAQATAVEADARADLLKEQQAKAETRSSSKERFEGRLRNLGVVDSTERGDNLSVVA
ncbi:putative metalloprotease CJM1_0395 family protein [Pleionea sediminis]|uniref:putative metalloprotease CJM1_0395 family protein n=1 Tax=Pleionea sediminis TaxID=2569479 RepID=UPI001FEA1A3E|nr:putative metalloprotease CJM1_0395 family protein [Pleionea sediminis]